MRDGTLEEGANFPSSGILTVSAAAAALLEWQGNRVSRYAVESSRLDTRDVSFSE